MPRCTDGELWFKQHNLVLYPEFGIRRAWDRALLFSFMKPCSIPCKLGAGRIQCEKVVDTQLPLGHWKPERVGCRC